jgi:hypothetical protein
MSVSYGGDKITFEDGSTVGSGWAGFKNRIINGAMAIDQRNGGNVIFSTASTTKWALDRMVIDNNGSGNVSCQKVTTAPVGFSNSLQITVNTTDTAASGDYLLLKQSIEGYNLTDFDLGKPTATTMTLSFWVRSSLTGTFSGGFRGADPFVSQTFNYTINASNTWEYKTVTITGFTSGTTNITTGLGLEVFWDLGSGSNHESATGSWVSGSKWRTAGAQSVVQNSGATWNITGIQLEKGSTASSFEWRPFGTELQLCQRYYLKQTVYVPDGGSLPTNWFFKVSMRTSPSISGGGSGYGNFAPSIESVSHRQTSAGAPILEANAEL